MLLDPHLILLLLGIELCNPCLVRALVRCLFLRFKILKLRWRGSWSRSLRLHGDNKGVGVPLVLAWNPDLGGSRRGSGSSSNSSNGNNNWRGRGMGEDWG